MKVDKKIQLLNRGKVKGEVNIDQAQGKGPRCMRWLRISTVKIAPSVIVECEYVDPVQTEDQSRHGDIASQALLMACTQGYI